MVKIICDMFIKQQGSYKRLINIAKQEFPNMKPLSTNTLILEGYPVLMMRFETGEQDSRGVNERTQMS